MWPRLTPNVSVVGRVTLQTIAERVGVSRMTVSNAFSRPDQLSSELRQRILAAADELGYVGPDPAGRALARGTSGAVGVLLTDSLRHAFTDEVATGFLAAVVDELAPTGLALTLLTTDGDSDAVAARDVAIDGALVYSCRPASAARDWLMRRNLPLVFVDQPPVPRISSVNVDDRGGARAAAQHLVDLGHRRVAIVTELVDGSDDNVDAGAVEPPATTTSYPVRQRMLGWLDALSRPASHRRLWPPSNITRSSSRGWPVRFSTATTTQPRCCASPTSSPSGSCGLPKRSGWTFPATCPWSASTTARPPVERCRR